MNELSLTVQVYWKNGVIETDGGFGGIIARMTDRNSQISAVTKAAELITASVERVFLGKRDVIERLVVALFARGHVLIEDVPGTGKTILARALAKSIDAPFSRIQCTPDLMPADITGVSVFSPADQKFRFRKGPIVSSIVLVDEINRATPRTQSALLEAMAEGQVSVDGKRLRLPEPFFLIATENPVEFEGTFPLPEAQKDRFLMCVSVGYPDIPSEAAMLEHQRRTSHPIIDLIPVLGAADVLAAQEAVVGVHVDESVRTYMLSLVAETRKDPRIRIGASPRGSLALYKSSQALAALRGRNYVVPEDVKELALPVFRKRIIIKPESLIRGYAPELVISEILERVPIPAFKERQ
jgi:MoxR-like ATPase